jgi:DnaJ-class molecular chaperone
MTLPPPYPPDGCPVCMGQGTIDEGNTYAPDSKPKLKTCTFCKGTGKDPRIEAKSQA